MPVTYKQIASVTVGSGGAADIEFTSIPGTFTDLILHISSRLVIAADTQSIKLRFNGSSSDYASRNLRGSGSAASSVNNVYGTDEIYVGESPANNATASTFGNGSLYFPNYAGSANKSMSADIVTENNGTGAWAYMTAGLWSNSAAITSILLTPESGTFAQHSTAVLYGIKKS